MGGRVGDPKGLKDLEIREWSVTCAALFMIATVTPRVTLGRQTLAEESSTPLRLEGEDVTIYGRYLRNLSITLPKGF
jgi:hypothetical protein